MSDVLRPPKDADARKRIVTKLDRSLIVEAGAGSGKTHEMAARMAAGVAEGMYEIEHMAAVTFTRKAAAELRGRFQLALEEELAKGGDDAQRERRLRSALSNLERFFAGTIHAFCARLLRERPVEAGVSPGFTELDETEEALVRQQAWRDYRAQAKAAGMADYLALLDAGLEPKHFEKAFRTVCQYEDVEFPPGRAEPPDTAKAWKAIEKFWKELQTFLPVSIDPASTCATQDRAERFGRSWRFVSKKRKDDAQLVKLLEMWQSIPKVVQKWWVPKTVAEQARQLHEDFRTSVVLPYLAAWRQYVYRRTITLLVGARENAEQERLRRNALSFNDLLLITAKVLRERPDVRQSLQRKYRWIFIDEFQDTDPVQAEIMMLLGGTVFVVGDPKQSIYRFRRADIDIYNDVRAKVGGADGSGIVRLTTNFRSLPALCDWVNRVFAGRFPAAPTQHSPQFAPLDANRLAPPRIDPALATLTIPASVDSGDVSAVEAECIARYIRAEIDAGRRKAGDFLILTRKKKPLRPYARALEALQVPIEVSGAGAFGESDEVRALALLLSALADPQDAIALVGVLRGPFFGLSDRDLFAYRQTGGYFSLFGGLAEAAPGQSSTAKAHRQVIDALDTLRRWYRWARMLPVGAALDRILEDSGALALAATSPGGVEAGDLLHAVDRVRAVLESGLTLADAADALLAWTGLDEDGPEESSEVDSLPLQPGRPDVVRLMNLHKAKGLEATVVFLADPVGGFAPRADVRIVRQSGSSAVGYFRVKKDADEPWKEKVLAEPDGWPAHEAAERAYLDAEGDRLLYVAATRAKDLLVVGRYAGKASRNAAWVAFDPYLAGVSELQVPAAVTLPKTDKVDLSAKTMRAAVSASDAAHVHARLASWVAVSVTAEAKAFPRIVPGADDGATDDPTRVVMEETPSRRADAGVEWGTLVHGLLEHAMRHKTATRADLRRLAMWLTMEEPQLRAVIEQALDTVESVSHADFWPTARASSEVHEEVPFTVSDSRAGIPTVLSGTIDLVYRTDDSSWRILDYKTDVDADAAALQKRYAMQLEMYKQAWAGFGRVSSSEVVGARRGSSNV